MRGYKLIAVTTGTLAVVCRPGKFTVHGPGAAQNNKERFKCSLVQPITLAEHCAKWVERVVSNAIGSRLYWVKK